MSEAVATSQQGLVGKYKPYPEYKDSGVEWLGEIPSEWQKMPLKRYCSVVSGYAFPSEMFIDSGLPVVRIGDIKSDGSVVLDDCKYIEEQNSHLYSRFAISPGELLMAMTGATIGKAGWFKSDTKAFLNQRVGSFRVSDCFEYKFLWYVLNSSGYQEYIQLTAFGGAQPNISDTGMLAYETAYPTINEQRAIAAFLDYETARIDRLIAQQQRLIELLKEKRQAVISHAVTKGLNPNAPMKDSGVEWLGQVPEHWVVTNLKYVFDSLDYRRIPLSAEQRGERQGDYPYYGASGVIDGVDDYLFDEECVLVGEDGANLIMRSTPLAFVVSGKYWVNNHAHILRMHDGLNRYWAAVINNVDIKPIVSGSAQPKLTAEALGNIKVAFPQDTTEREELLIHINAETPKFDELIGHANQQVILLKERRSALISAAVTGKIDLRGWTPPAEEVAA